MLWNGYCTTWTCTMNYLRKLQPFKCFESVTWKPVKLSTTKSMQKWPWRITIRDWSSAIEPSLFSTFRKGPHLHYHDLHQNFCICQVLAILLRWLPPQFLTSWISILWQVTFYGMFAWFLRCGFLWWGFFFGVLWLDFFGAYQVWLFGSTCISFSWIFIMRSSAWTNINNYRTRSKLRLLRL